MKVSGDLDGTDLLLLRDMAGRDMHGGETAGRLRHLDLSEARLRRGGAVACGNVLLRQERDDKLGDYAFYGCGALETLCLPDTCGGGGGVGLLFMQGTFRVGVRPENRKGRG